MKKLKYYRKIVFFILLFILPHNIRHIFNYEEINSLECFRENLTFFFCPFDLGIIFILSTFLWEKWEDVKSNFYSNIHLYHSFMFFVFILVVSSYFSDNKIIAYYNSIRVIEAIIFFLIAKNILSQHSRTFFQGAYLIFLTGTIQSITAIFQFITQKSVGVFVLGESHINSNMLGVAKIENAGEKIIRGYGTLPHPNILGAFLLFSFVCGAFLLIQWEEDSLFTRKWKTELLNNIKNNIRLFRWDEKSMRIFILIIGLIIIATGIILTFSRATWLGFVMIVFFIVIKWLINNKHHFPIFNQVFFKNKQPTEKFLISNEQKLLLRDTFFLGSLYIIVVLVFLSPLIANRTCINNCNYGNESIQFRKEYIETAKNVIKDNPIFGIGSGNFVPTMNNYTARNFNEWEKQPVHSLYFLITSEVGFVGLIIIVYFVIYSIKETPYKRLFGMVFLVYLFLGIFDHFFASTFQGQLFFWSCLAFFSASCNIEKKEESFDNF